MSEINNPHYAFFKRNFGNIEIAKDFLRMEKNNGYKKWFFTECTPSLRLMLTKRISG